MMPANRLRRHSISSGDESFHPHPAKLNGLPRQGSRRRARLPRSKSASNVFDAYSRISGTTDHDMRDVAFEQADIATLRELANFLRTTGPPTERPANDDCLPFPAGVEPRRWSLQSFRRNKRIKLQRYSLSHLPENVIPGTTAEGHRYIAISTPSPVRSTASTADGPWFRSQYPVFLPQTPSSSPPPRPASSPRAWPERKSSKAASVSGAEKAAPSGSRNSPHSTGRLANQDNPPRAPAREGVRSRALSNRVNSDHILRAMLNPVDEAFERDLGSPARVLGLQKVDGMEQEQIQTLHQAPAPTYGASPTRPSQHEIRGQSPPVSLENGGSPRPPNRSSRRPGNILVRANLAVPKGDLPPESPGFPNMLASMTFPCPPKGSRPSSPASTTSSVPDSQGSPGPRPVVLPRTSSRRACTSTPGSAASLDELVMQTRLGSTRAKSDRLTYGPKQANSGASVIEAPSGSRSSTATPEHPSSLVNVVSCETDHGSTDRASVPGSSHEQSVVPSGDDGDECHRESLASQLTATTESSRQSTLTYNSSRSSSASEMSTQSKSTITAQNTASEMTQTSGPVGVLRIERCADVEGVESKPGVTGQGNMNVGLVETGHRECGEQHVEPQRPSLRLSTTSNTTTEPNPQSKSILERRLARKAKVREYKMRDLDASRADVVDSPVLGYFCTNISHGPSAQVNNARRPSTLSMATTVSDTANESVQNFDARVPVALHSELPVREDYGQKAAAVDVSRTSTVGLKMSAVITAEIEPIYPPAPHWHSSGITMSPIMVVADVESQPGSPTLRISGPARLETPSPRTMARLKPLKISAHSRQKSHTVTISRNPSTGVIERSASGPIDPKFNRRSLMTMPTPPLSPEATLLSKRLSLPPTQSHFPITPRDRTSPSRRSEWQSSPEDEQEPDSRLRSAALRERVMREKLQKEKEITDIVAKTVGLPPKQAAIAYDEELDPPALTQSNAESLEKRLRRLERHNDAWLCAMKPLLETMARTLDDMRADDRCRSLRMSDFVIDMEAEARRVTHSRRGEKENIFTTLQSSGTTELGRTTRRNNLDTFSSTPLSPVPQEFDDSPALDNQTALITLRTSDILPRKNQELPTTSQSTVYSSSGSESRSSEASQRRMPLQKTTKTLADTEPGNRSEKKTTPAQCGETETNIQATGTAVAGCADEGGEPSEWSDLDLLIQEFGDMPRKSWEEREAARSPGGSPREGVNALNPLMRELMSASQLTEENVTTAR
ncbi:hypothetical protein F5Y10DRAFT_205655 [Nemania abortiva]|nr:hypothetical protein F5Y10DRAFT_205655 [Nemania abortiva]